MRPATDAWTVADPCACSICGKDSCEDHLPPETTSGIPDNEIEDGVAVAKEGQAIERAGVPYLVDGLIPNYGMLGFEVAFSKVGKTSLSLALGAHVAMGRSFLDRPTMRARVLVLAAEDPPEYTAWLARHLTIEPGWLMFRRRPLILTDEDLDRLCHHPLVRIRARDHRELAGRGPWADSR